MSTFLDPPSTDKIKYIFLKQVPIGAIFRYKKEFYERASYGLAVNKDEIDVLDIDNLNKEDAVAVAAHVIEWD